MTLRHKFNAVRTEVDGIKFASKKEAKWYGHYKLLQKAGDVLFFLRQVPFDLPGGVKYRCDFLVFWSNGTVSVIDVKGVKTPEFIAKKKMVEDLYNPVRIEIV